MILLLKRFRFLSIVTFTQLMPTTQPFSLKDKNYIVHLSEKLKLFSNFLDLKPNATKCGISGTNTLKGGQAAVCGLRCIDLRNEAIKILCTYFSFKIKKDKKKIIILFQIFKVS